MDNKVRRSKRIQGRMPSDERRRLIVAKAIPFFAEHGFEANTRLLASKIGVTQPLLFSYFSTKEQLLEAVFAEVYARQGNREWLSIISNPLRPLRERLIAFSRLYASRTYDYNWIRLYVYAALAGGAVNRYYIANVTEPLLYQIAIEVRKDHGLLPVSETAVTRQEIEYLWVFHSGLYYASIRKHIYRMAVEEDISSGLIELSVDTMLLGYGRLLEAIDPADSEREAKLHTCVTIRLSTCGENPAPMVAVRTPIDVRGARVSRRPCPIC